MILIAKEADTDGGPSGSKISIPEAPEKAVTDGKNKIQILYKLKINNS